MEGAINYQSTKDPELVDEHLTPFRNLERTLWWIIDWVEHTFTTIRCVLTKVGKRTIKLAQRGWNHYMGYYDADLKRMNNDQTSPPGGLFEAPSTPSVPSGTDDTTIL
jgi:hypothetical protein